MILSGSPRNRENSDLLCDEFMRGALDSGNGVEKIRVAEKKGLRRVSTSVIAPKTATGRTARDFPPTRQTVILLIG